MTSALLRDVILPRIRNPVLDSLDDGAYVQAPAADLVLTTDAYVVSPLFFPGGDIGRLAVCGTVNDLAMQGARPLWLTLSLIIEEGFALSDLERVMDSVGRTAAEAGVLIAAGDTKVVERGAGNGLFVCTSGVGVRREGVDTSVSNARPGDVVIINGPVGDHGVAVMSVREGLGFETEVTSDAAPLHDLVASVLDVCPEVHCLRDPTRGGVTAALCDIAEASGVGIRISEEAIPVRDAVRGACDLLGLDPLNAANEGKAVVIAPASCADRVLEVMRCHPLGREAARIGRVTEGPCGRVLLETRIGGERLLLPPAGEELPRIC